MRITNSMMVTNMIRNINSNLSRLSVLQQQSASGKTIQYASDNPVLATRALKIKSYLSDVEQLQKNADDAKSWMDYSESSLDQIGDNVTRIRELMVEGANGVYTDEDKESILLEIQELKKSIIEIGNSNYSGRYVFSGYDTSTKPFETVSTSIGEMVMYKGKYMSLGGTVSSEISDDDIKAFYLDNMDKISGQPELISAAFQTFTAAAPNLDFTMTLDGVSQTISLTDGTTYDLSTLETELQTKIRDAFPSDTGQPDPLIKLSTENGKLKFTVQDGESIRLESGTLDIGNIGFVSGVTSNLNDKQEINYKVGSGNRVTINEEGNSIFGQGDECIFETLAKLELALAGETSYKTASYAEGPPGEVIVESHDLNISDLLGDIDTDINRILKSRANLGARTNYVELTKSRLEDNYNTFTELLSSTEDADYAEVSLKLSSAETVYSAALSAGSKVIQKSLLDFLG